MGEYQPKKKRKKKRGMYVSRRVQNIWLGVIALLTVGAVAWALAPTERPVTASEQSGYFPTVKPKDPWERMAVVGDSYSMSDYDQWWHNRTAACIHHDLTLSGVGGSGFYARGDDDANSPYSDPERIKVVADADPHLVIIEVAYNDSWQAENDPEQIRTLATDTLTQYQKAAPDAQIVVMGPFWAEKDLPTRITTYRDILASVTDELGVAFIDASNWLKDPDQIGDDGKHPSIAGHKHIMTNLVTELVRAGLAKDYKGCSGTS